MSSVASIPEKYRKIPTAIIDAYIVEHGGIPKNTKLPVEDWLKKGSYSPHDKERQRLAKDYALEKSLCKIPRSIKLGIAYRENEWPGFIIVDSPGIEAIGGFGEITHKHIGEANALLFVKSIGNCVEDRSFIEFVRKNVQKKQKSSIFLVFSRRSNHAKYELDSKLDEAKDIFKEDFEAARIFNVDSLAQVILHDMRTESCIKVLREKYANKIKEEKAKASVKTITHSLHMKLDMLESKLSNFPSDEAKQKLKEIANFDQLENAINGLITQSGNILICDILQRIDDGYAQIAEKVNEDLNDLNNDEFQVPQIAAKEIQNRKDHIDEIQDAAYNFSSDIAENYKGNIGSEVDIDFKKIESLAEHNLEKCNSIDECVKVFREYQTDFSDLVSKYQNQIKSKYNDLQDKLNVDLKRPDINVSIPKVSLPGIIAIAEKNSFESVNVPRDPEGFWETICSIFVSYTKKIRQFNSNKHLENVKKDFINKIKDYTKNGRNTVPILAKNVNTSFNDSMKELLHERKKGLDDLMNTIADGQKKSEGKKILEDKREKLFKEQHLMKEISTACRC
ncbi:MAG: hypothetical protein OXC62_12565 [Aestuariivita sp.]|nr:hypothetical protein [Aestuariivita sp.]